MIIVISRFPIPSEMGTAGAIEAFEKSVARYQKVDGLLRKHYYLDGEGHGGGVYAFRDEASARSLFDERFFQNIEARFGGRPEVNYLPVALEVDNENGQVLPHFQGWQDQG